MKVEFENLEIFISSGGVQWQADQPTLYMQHGAGLDRTVWVLLGRYFARHGYNVIAPDLPGHGASEGQPFTSIEDNAAWVNRLVAHLGESQSLSATDLIYCGHSMGSLVLLEAAAAQVEKMSRLILLGSAVPMVVGEPLLNAARDNDHSAIDMINMFGHGFGSRVGNNPVSGISAYNTMEALLARSDDGVLFTDLNSCNEYVNGEAAAKSLSGKVVSTVIAGDSDRMTPIKFAHGLSQTLGADYILLEDCGHMMMSERPEESLQAIKKALR